MHGTILLPLIVTNRRAGKSSKKNINTNRYEKYPFLIFLGPRLYICKYGVLKTLSWRRHNRLLNSRHQTLSDLYFPVLFPCIRFLIFRFFFFFFGRASVRTCVSVYVCLLFRSERSKSPHRRPGIAASARATRRATPRHRPGCCCRRPVSELREHIARKAAPCRRRRVTQRSHAVGHGAGNGAPKCRRRRHQWR